MHLGDNGSRSESIVNPVSAVGSHLGGKKGKF